MTDPAQNPLRAWHFRQLESSMRSLALAPSEQLSLFPEVVTINELVFGYEHWSSVVRATYDGELSASQARSLAAIDARLATMSRDAAEFDPELWTEAGLRSSGHWEQVRLLAAAALEEFGWPATTPGALAAGALDE